MDNSGGHYNHTISQIVQTRPALIPKRIKCNTRGPWRLSGTDGDEKNEKLCA